MTNVRWCSNCLAMSTRPRITFDDRGWCNACRWMEKKRDLNWDTRQIELNKLLDKHRRQDGGFDCLVPVSGGKDGSYVSYSLKHKYGMNPLCLTVTPALPLTIGEKNLRAFVESGYNHISVNPAHEAMRLLNKRGFVEMGFPYYGWLIAIQSVPVRIAFQLEINLIFYGEDGEVEYGGSTETDKNPIYDVQYMKRIYLEGGYSKVLNGSGIPESDLSFFRFPEDDPLIKSPIDITHWSYFENWDPYRNYLVAKEYCGLKEAESSNSGTFTNFAQNDQALYALHTYLMYLKFGFGRANQDASIEIRRGAMDRSQAVNLVRLYDGQYPHEFLETYLDYYQMNQSEFDAVLDRWANRDLFEKVGGYWQPQFVVV
ncbi:N-acetyl sugar amidotransferase [Cylindrospermopsis raciborskii]|uniref:N-acetyl sugar amidotransferase n=1 Tax=Cylindrospermopsis raciborskii TaxID=77022 RepID=UPI0009F6089C|nr:N-acetyl sugar amidotransferase [Cylindrospermopsis raciborskii]NLQ05930.1 N-acetyl sugar amidotransferase [Cylindrospermopsis raciborskii MVCC19]